jgi:hypothetical protein
MSCGRSAATKAMRRSHFGDNMQSLGVAHMQRVMRGKILDLQPFMEHA